MNKFGNAVASLVAVAALLIVSSCSKETVTPAAPDTPVTPVTPAFVPTEPVPEAVDLGLPSGTLWSSFNLGASAREEKGKVYAWGELEEKSEYTWENYRFRTQGTTSDDVIFSKYVTGTGRGEPDGRTMLGLEDDAAHVHLGGYWRMPTRAEYQELIRFCSKKEDTINGADGLILSSTVEGFRSKSIFLPCFPYIAGKKYYTMWQSELYDDTQAYFAYGSISDNSEPTARSYRRAKFSIRPVYNVPLRGLSLGASVWLERGATRQMEITKFPADASWRSFDWTSSNEAVATVDEKGCLKAVSVGKVTITVSTKNEAKLTASCEVNVFPDLPVPEAVDLGLPSGTRWATFNLGASKPSEKGKYYAWGELEEKSQYTWQNCRFRTEGSEPNNVKFSKYVSSTGGNHGTPDDKLQLDDEDDAAHSHLGGYWRMPTKEQKDELWNNCDRAVVTVDGQKGLRFTSKMEGFESVSIFIPYSGYINESGETDSENLYAWLSSLYEPASQSAWYLNNKGKYCLGRYQGMPIRPVNVEYKK